MQGQRLIRADWNALERDAEPVRRYRKPDKFVGTKSWACQHNQHGYQCRKLDCPCKCHALELT